MTLRQYPTVKDIPSRKSRKAQRRTIFYENKTEGNRLRKERREIKKKIHEETN